MRLIRGFLTADERAFLLEHYRRLEQRGRAPLTARSYQYAAVDLDGDARVLVGRARAELHAVGRFHDSFLLCYGDGARAAPHVDLGRLERLIALVEAPLAGGELIIGGEPADLAPGDAVVFRPWDERHEVREVRGRRIVWSVGVRSDVIGSSPIASKRPAGGA